MTAAGPRLVALDLSLTGTGIAWTHTPEGTPELGCRTTAPRSDGHQRVHELTTAVATACQSMPDLVLIERLPMYDRGDTTIRLAELHGCVKQFVWTMGLAYLMVTPQHIKMYATGRGDARKGDVLRAVQGRYPVYVATDDEADALALLALGMHAYGHAPAPVPDTHSRAVGMVRWPDLAEAVSHQ